MDSTATKNDKSSAFVDYVFALCQRDKGAAARLRRADNPASEYQSWEVLAAFNIRLDFEAERLAYVTVAAAIAKSQSSSSGKLPLGRAIAMAFEDGNASDQANMRLRRLLACDSSVEACRHLRSLLALIRSRVSQPLDYAKLLRDLTWFNHDSQRVKARWAQEFYRNESQPLRKD